MKVCSILLVLHPAREVWCGRRDAYLFGFEATLPLRLPRLAPLTLTEWWTGIGLNCRLKLSTKQILSIEKADNELEMS